MHLWKGTRNHQSISKIVMFSEVRGEGEMVDTCVRLSVLFISGVAVPQVFLTILWMPTSLWVGSQMLKRIWGTCDVPCDLSLMGTKRSALAFYFHY